MIKFAVWKSMTHGRHGRDDSILPKRLIADWGQATTDRSGADDNGE